MQQVDFLGHHITAEWATPIARHVEAVQNFPRPQDKKLQLFLILRPGPGEFLLPFYPGGDEDPDPAAEVNLAVDASNTHIGAVLQRRTPAAVGDRWIFLAAPGCSPAKVFSFRPRAAGPPPQCAALPVPARPDEVSHPLQPQASDTGHAHGLRAMDGEGAASALIPGRADFRCETQRR
jgi:hypothetical protein